jgi:ABC-type sugar transport system ATPase subunit
MSGVVVRGLSKSYGAVHALNAIDMEVETGDFAVLLGPSGCGKSTLLNAIAGLDEIDAGSVEIGLRVTAPLPLHAENTFDEGQLTRSFGVRCSS